MDIEPVTLEGRLVRLVPLSAQHLDALCRVGLTSTLWRWTVSKVTNRMEMHHYVQRALEEQKAGTALPFAIKDVGTDSVIGSTRFGNISRDDRRVEIGWSWIGLRWQGAGFNTECKLLMLRHAFAVWDCVRVEFKTNTKNLRSRAALAKIGATEEGTLRRHMINEDGSIRDTVYFSVILEEWPAVESGLVSRLG